MQPISIFPQTIKSARLVLRVLPPTKENATILLDIINKNRDYFMDWQAHFGELKTVDDVVAYLTKRENQIKTNLERQKLLYIDSSSSSDSFCFLSS